MAKLKQKPQKPPKEYQLIKAIRGKKQKNIEGEPSLYKANVKRRDARVRKYVEENVEKENIRSVLPGQLIMFDYFYPKTEEQLEYYDAMPCTIFFGIRKTELGKRVIGFNLHYYPPRIRYMVMDRIFDIFKPFYLQNWNKSLNNEIPDFNYRMIMKQLERAKLDFGIRQYIPELMRQIRPIPPKDWQKAVFTEGRFKKQTRDQILKYWTDKLANKVLNKIQ